MDVWYKIKANVIELMEFLINTELIIDKDDVIDLVDHPDKYDGVWVLYSKEMLGVY